MLLLLVQKYHYYQMQIYFYLRFLPIQFFADKNPPILRGRDIKRYAYDWANLYLIATFPACNYDIDKYPAIKQYLLSFAEKDLREAGYDWVADSYLADFCKQKLAQTGEFVEIEGKRITIGTTPEKARKKTNNHWFETQDSISYWVE